MKIAILAAIRSILRPLAAKLFPEQFKEQEGCVPACTHDQNQSSAVVDTFTPPEFKQYVLNKLRREHPYEALTEHSTEAEIRHAVGYGLCIRHLDRLWEIR